jgi:hypothetical protein
MCLHNRKLVKRETDQLSQHYSARYLSVQGSSGITIDELPFDEWRFDKSLSKRSDLFETLQ